MPVFALLFLAGLAVPRAIPAASYPCEPSLEVRQACESLPDMYDFRIPYETRMAPLRALLEKHPRDIFVHRRYQDAFRRSLHMSQEFDRAFALYRLKPDDPVSRYLEARLIGSFHPNKAEQMLEQLIKEHPDLSWPHLTIVELLEHPWRRDAKKAAAHLGAFLRGCRESLEGLSLLHTVEDPELIRGGTVKLRSLLKVRRDASWMTAWRTLWDLEFRVTPKDQQEAQRQRVLRDVEELKKIPPVPTWEWNAAFWHARQLTLDDGIVKWLEETVLRLFPDSDLALDIERQRFIDRNPPPGDQAKREEWKEYEARNKAARTGWRKRWPDNVGLLQDRYFELQSDQAAAVPVEEKLAVADEYAALMRRSPDAGMSVPPLSMFLAECYVKWHVRLEQVPELVRRGLREMEEQEKYKPDASMIPEEERGRMEDQVGFTCQRGNMILADLYLATKQTEPAREAIRQGLAEIEAQEPARRQQAYGFQRQEWLARRARLAELEGDIPNALSLFQESLRPVPREFLEGKHPSEEVAAIKKFYLAHGGKEESWIEWATAGLGAEPVKLGPLPPEFTKLLPDFEASDLSGRPGRLSDLRGKATFVDVWATWCGPCRGEHEELQALYEKIKDRKDIQLLTLSLDENPYLVESHLKEHKLKFPVVVSQELALKLFPVVGLPSRYLVNPEGRRSSYFWFGNADRTFKELEKVAGAR